ncbi:hypothetical protein BDZ91DRAFT_552059 [Kalaharituber pfeilii]|nr:hypothetical protein BDZ91DRAFT_552059 [Kalaharituber pfeilii]
MLFGARLNLVEERVGVLATYATAPWNENRAPVGFGRGGCEKERTPGGEEEEEEEEGPRGRGSRPGGWMGSLDVCPAKRLRRRTFVRVTLLHTACSPCAHCMQIAPASRIDVQTPPIPTPHTSAHGESLLPAIPRRPELLVRSTASPGKSQIQTRAAHIGVMATKLSLKHRRMLLTGAVAVITASGAYAGAVWKSGVEEKEAYTKLRQETPAEKIRRLQNYRQDLVKRRTELERKIAEIDEKKKHRTES